MVAGHRASFAKGARGVYSVVEGAGHCMKTIALALRQGEPHGGKRPDRMPGPAH